MNSLSTKSLRQLAAAFLTRNAGRSPYIDHIIESSAAYGRLPAADRRLLLELVNGVLRHKSFLDIIARHYMQRGYSRFEVGLKNIFRIAFFQLALLDRIPSHAVVYEAVEAAKSEFGPRKGKLVNAVLRSYLRAPFQPAEPAADDLAGLSAYYSHPLWIIHRFVEQFGRERLVGWLRRNNAPAALFVRSLHHLVPGEGFGEALLPHEIAPYFRLQPGWSLSDLPGWEEGRFIVQDPSAGLAVLLAAPAAGDRFIELCAAPGGKTIALANMLGDGEIDAVEISPARMDKLRRNLERCRLRNVKTVQADARQVKLAPADAVLVDAPCSGLGVLGRRADLRWKRSAKDLRTLRPLQEAILANAAHLLKPGGRLIYSTCSIDREENEEVVRKFLREHGDFVPVPARGLVAEKFLTPEGFVRAFPDLHGIDGAFAARLLKKGTP